MFLENCNRVASFTNPSSWQQMVRPPIALDDQTQVLPPIDAITLGTTDGPSNISGPQISFSESNQHTPLNDLLGHQTDHISGYEETSLC